MNETLPNNTDPQPGELVAAQLSMVYRGTVPPPNVVEAYEKMIPGAADRFLQMAEREQQRRIDNEKASAELARAQEENGKANYRWGLICSCGLMVFYLIIMFVCVLLKAPTEFLVAMLGVPALSAIAGIVTQLMFKRQTTKTTDE
jgi:uncharacterized membrane protein